MKLTLSILGLMALASTAHAATNGFYTDFESNLPTEIAPSDAQKIEGVQKHAGLGPVGNQIGGSFLRSPTGNTATLTLTGLPAHSAVNLDFLFAAIDSLDGTVSFLSSDFYPVTRDGKGVFRESFANASLSQIPGYVAPVPLPAALPFLSSGLAWLVAFRARRGSC